MVEQFTHLMVHSGAGWVLWIIGLLSLVSVAIVIERAWAFRWQRNDTNNDARALVPALRRLLRLGDLSGAQALLARSKRAEATVVAAGLAEVESGSETVQEVMAAAMGLERSRLEKNLLILGTIGNNVPFVGLLGTVIGIVGAFDQLGQSQTMSHGLSAASSALAPEGVMSAVAEALVATAAGLMVAIPAVAAFNYFQGRINVAVSDAETLGHVLLGHMKSAALVSNKRLTATSQISPPHLKNVVNVLEKG